MRGRLNRLPIGFASLVATAHGHDAGGFKSELLKSPSARALKVVRSDAKLTKPKPTSPSARGRVRASRCISPGEVWAGWWERYCSRKR